MNFSFNISSQAEELIARLQLGQIIQVQVLEKSGNSQYLISYRNIQLTAVSEVDLLSKSVWLKVTQKVPFPKFQLIIEENESSLNHLFKYANENNLIIPYIPDSIKTYLSDTSTIVDIKGSQLYDFIDLYTEKLSWSVFNETDFMNLLSNGIPVDELLMLYNIFPFSMGQEINKSFSILSLSDILYGENMEVKGKILSSIKDLDDIESEYKNKFMPIMTVLEKINLVLNHKERFTEKKVSENLNKISLLYIKHPLFFLILPIECTIDDSVEMFSSILKTKHFGSVLLKYTSNGKKTEIKMLFENNIYINSLKDNLAMCINGKDITLNLSLHPNIMHNNYSQKEWIKKA
ncbi:MAG: hypothetical protein FWG98_07900 [Candidatus Cloacimonetes bacterium]|nr:hypothetical protein [Candidatus Cloacimonadota bacterium]